MALFKHFYYFSNNLCLDFVMFYLNKAKLQNIDRGGGRRKRGVKVVHCPMVDVVQRRDFAELQRRHFSVLFANVER